MVEKRDLEHLLVRQIEFVRAADHKFSPIIPTTAAILAISATLLRVATPTIYSHLILIGVALVAVAIIIVSLHATLPVLTSRKPSLIFFGDAAKMRRDDYVEQLIGLSDEELCRQLAEQAHANGVVAAARFRAASWCNILLSILLLLFIAFFLTLTFP